MKTHAVKKSEITNDWYIIDASGQTLGRLASFVAARLNAKHKTNFSPHLDMADNIVVINASKIRVSGNKLTDKMYYRHSGYPGGIKETNLQDLMTKHPTRALELAVKGMLPKNRLQDVRLGHLKVYPLAEHPHAPQQPKPLEVK